MLLPGGRIGLFWNVGVLPPELKLAIDAVYEQYASGLDRYSVLLGNAGPERFEVAADSLKACGFFSGVDVKTYRHEMNYTNESWLDQLPTHSDHASLDPAHLARLSAAVGAEIDQAGGSILVRYDTCLVSAYRDKTAE